MVRSHGIELLPDDGRPAFEEALAEAEARGWTGGVPSVNVCEVGGDRMGEWRPEVGIRVDPDAWRDVADRRVAVRSPAGVLLHELGHARAGEVAGSWLTLSDGLGVPVWRLRRVAHPGWRGTADDTISTRARHSPDEYVAEVHAALCFDVSLTDGQRRLYDELGGPAVGEPVLSRRQDI